MTRSGVTKANARPGRDCAGHLPLCHSGTVENVRDLRDDRLGRGQTC